MSTGRKSQLEKFNAKMAKKKREDDYIAELNAKKESTKTLEEKGLDVMKTAKPNATREDVFAVIARDSMESFIKLWNNSMESVIRETVRNEVKNVVREVIQEELEIAVRGVFKGINQSMNLQGKVEEIIEEVIDDQAWATELTRDVEALMVDKKPKQKRTAVATPKRSKCGKCGEYGHNARTCNKVTV